MLSLDILHQLSKSASLKNPTLPKNEQPKREQPKRDHLEKVPTRCGFQIIIDDRERAVIPFLMCHDDKSISVKRITIGDFCIIYPNDQMIIIERKTWADLADSIKDNRMGNIRDLIRARNECDAKPIYIIEGYLPKNMNKKIRGIRACNLKSKLDHIMMRDSIPIIYTLNPTDTATRIIELGKNCSTLFTEPKDVVPAVKYIKDKKPDIPKKEQEMNMLCHIKGVSSRTADALFKIYTLPQIINGIDAEELRNIKYDSGVSIKKATIRRLLNLKKEFPAMLTTIKGVSPTISTEICEKIDFKSLVNGEIDISTLSNIELSGKRRRCVGLIVATRIIEFFTQVPSPDAPES